MYPCDLSMNMEQPVIGVSNCIICDIILYLTAQNLNVSKISPKVVKTFGEELFVRLLNFHEMFWLFSNRFRYHLGFEWKDAIRHTYHWSFHVHTDVILVTFVISQWDLYSVVEIPNINNFYDLTYICYIVWNL